MTSRPDFDAIVAATRLEFGIRVRRWRTTMSGCAWRVDHPGGRSIRWVEAPRPKSPLSLSIFLHEVGHHVIGFDRYTRRCEEEYHVWLWAIDRLRWLGIEPGRERDAAVRPVDAVRRFESDAPRAQDGAERFERVPDRGVNLRDRFAHVVYAGLHGGAIDLRIGDFVRDAGPRCVTGG